MKRYEGQGVGEVLQKLIRRAEAEQPVISVILEGRGDGHDGLTVVPSGSMVMLGGRKIKLFTVSDGQTRVFFWNAAGQKAWPGEEGKIIAAIEVF